MAAAFGFSVGDFIGTISLIKDIIKALNDSTGARPAYTRLQVELSNLDDALTRVHNLEVHATQQPQKAALQTVAVQCQESIKRFLEKNAKFRGTLGQAPSPSSSRLSSSSLASSWRSNLHKVQWARFKNDSINALRAELAGHTTTINLILHLIQAATVKSNADAIDTCLQSVRVLQGCEKETSALVTKNHSLLTTQTDMITSISQTVTVTSQQTSSLQSLMQQSSEQNMKMYSKLVEMHNTLQNQVPAQVKFQQPVCLEDPHGNTLPFHLEFINSWEAFEAVMNVRISLPDFPGFKKCFPGFKKGFLYRIADTSALNYLVQPHDQPWCSALRPGKKYIMLVERLVFQELGCCHTSLFYIGKTWERVAEEWCPDMCCTIHTPPDSSTMARYDMMSRWELVKNFSPYF